MVWLSESEAKMTEVSPSSGSLPCWQARSLSIDSSSHHSSSPELAPLFMFCFFWGSLCFPPPGQKHIFVAGALIPGKSYGASGAAGTPTVATQAELSNQSVTHG